MQAHKAHLKQFFNLEASLEVLYPSAMPNKIIFKTLIYSEKIIISENELQSKKLQKSIKTEMIISKTGKKY